jgi:hypothetical protein
VEAAIDFQFEHAWKQAHINETLKNKVPFLIRNMSMLVEKIVVQTVTKPDPRADDCYVTEEDTEEPVVCERESFCNAR